MRLPKFVIKLLFVIILAIIIWFLISARQINLEAQQYFSGWLLVSSILLLMLYGIRKRFSMLPLKSNAWWLQLHIYLGMLTTLVFFCHVEWSLPNGWLETTLYILFISILLSGLIGLYLSKTIPRKLTQRGGEVIYERIPSFIRELREEAQQLVVETTRKTGSSTLADFYLNHLAGFFAKQRNFSRHLIRSHSQMVKLLEKLEDLERYLDPEERRYARQFAVLVKKKDYLDYHYALQFLLKGWLLIHVPLISGVFVFLCMHVVLVYAFHSAVQ